MFSVMRVLWYAFLLFFFLYVAFLSDYIIPLRVLCAILSFFCFFLLIIGDFDKDESVNDF